MSNPDSFIDEVTEEVRRDKLYGLMRRYGWIGIVLVLAIVAGAGISEWRKAQADARAQAFGDAVLDALDLGAPEDRRAALGNIATDGDQTGILQLLLASDPETDRAGTLAALDALAADASQPQSYRDLATLRRVIVAGADMPAADRRAALDPIAAPGRPFRTLALEQMAYLLVEDGKTDDAIAALTALTEDQEAPAGLRTRVGQMIVALGGELAPADDTPLIAPVDGAATAQDAD